MLKVRHSLVLSLATIIILLCLLAAAGSGFGVRLELWSSRTGFTILRWSVYIVGLAVALGIVSVVLAKIDRKLTWDWRYLLLSLVAIVTFVVPYNNVREFRSYKTIADATTDFKDPPVFVDLVPIRNQSAKNPLAYRGEKAAKRQQEFFPELSSIELSVSAEDVVKAAESVAIAMGFEVVSVVPEQGRLEATEVSFWFGFKDDVVLRAVQFDNGKTLVDMRSASRVGFRDGGVNAMRIENFLEALQKQL